MHFYNQFNKNLKKKRDKVFVNSISGKNIQLAYIHLDYGETTNHSHAQEQLGYILSGEIEITIKGSKQICRSGDAYQIPSNVSHRFKIITEDGADYIEIFSPVKKDNSIP